MQKHTLTDMAQQSIPVQIGEPFRCWECGALDQGGYVLRKFTSAILDHPLEAFADHIYYMRLTCGHNNRCIRLGDAIAPLQPLDRSIEENLTHVREGLARLAKAVPSDKQTQDPVSKIVYLLVAGRISPQSAINQLRDLNKPGEPFQPARLPVIDQAWR